MTRVWDSKLSVEKIEGLSIKSKSPSIYTIIDFNF